jgi:hypothetical protein
MTCLIKWIYIVLYLWFDTIRTQHMTFKVDTFLYYLQTRHELSRLNRDEKYDLFN